MGLWEHSSPVARPVVRGRPSAADGAASLSWIAAACDLAAQGICDALVTGPVSKAVIASSGAPGARCFGGHTEYLAERLGAGEVVMAFAGRSLTTALVTTHLPVAAVPAAITAPRVARACVYLAELLVALGRRSPRLVVAALNPHAGEQGMFGGEERSAIVPGIQRARRRLGRAGVAATLTGPMGAESAFRLAAGSSFDGVVGMYHDQATIPCKLLGFGDMVNVTLGLPILRTSVDHGTAYDAARAGRPSPRSMVAAMAMAARLARRD
jgi:4-hydroxythreonine-4-phosphate dehydrogenase